MQHPVFLRRSARQPQYARPIAVSVSPSRPQHSSESPSSNRPQSSSSHQPLAPAPRKNSQNISYAVSTQLHHSGDPCPTSFPAHKIPGRVVSHLKDPGGGEDSSQYPNYFPHTDSPSSEERFERNGCTSYVAPVRLRSSSLSTYSRNHKNNLPSASRGRTPQDCAARRSIDHISQVPPASSPLDPDESNSEDNIVSERPKTLTTGTGGRSSSHFSLFWKRRRDTASSTHYPGFDNLGNTCYMNSALQCLVATPLLSDYFYTGMHELELQRENKLGSGGILATAFENLIHYCRDGSAKTSLNLSVLKAAIVKFNPLFKGYEQHDAQEFLAVFLDGVHEDLNRASHKDKPKEPDINRATVNTTRFERLGAEAWQRYLCRNKSFLVDLFQGQLESRVTCLRCNDFSLKFEPFMYLSLPVRSPGLRSIKTLEDALAAFSRPERLPEAVWKCPQCCTKVPAEKRMNLIKLPPVLIIHFKRFEFDECGSRKLEEYIEAPVERLNMHRLVEQKHAPVYDLYAVIDHSGHAVCGHYTSSCLRDNRWYRFDDNYVYPIDPSWVVNENNYVLFYQRRDVPTKPDLLRRQTLRHPEHWPHSLRSESIEDIKRTGIQGLVKWNSLSKS